MKKIKNQSGLTLIEVLATLTILSFVTIILYSIFANGLHYSNQAKETVLIQQEANYLLTILKEQHEKSNSYSITVEDDYKKVVIKDSANKTVTIENPNYHYRIYRYDPYTPNSQELFENNVEYQIDSTENFPIFISIESISNPNLKFEVKTILSRL